MSFQYTSGDPSHLTGGFSPATMADIQGPFTDLKTFLNARIAAIPTLVSALPGSPVDAQEVYYLADATNGVVWHLRYRAASGSSSKWEFVGGAPLRGTVDAGESTAAGAFVNLATVGPDVTLPLAGDYEVRFEAAVSLTGAGLATVSIGLNVAGGGVTGTDRADVTLTNTGYSASPMKSRLKTGVSANTLVRLQYGTTSAVTAQFAQRRVLAFPVRVG